MSTEALIDLVNKFPIIQDMRRADYKESKKKNIKYSKGDWSNGSISFFLSSWNKEILVSQKCSL